jgi:hypothetical protein
VKKFSQTEKSIIITNNQRTREKLFSKEPSRHLPPPFRWSTACSTPAISTRFCQDGWSCQGCQGLRVFQLSAHSVKGSSAFSLPGHLEIGLYIADIPNSFLPFLDSSSSNPTPSGITNFTWHYSVFSLPSFLTLLGSRGGQKYS